jgi:serine/threonine-protein kinase
MYRHTGEAEWLRRGRDLADTAAAGVTALVRDDCISGSLHKGELGIAVLAADLERPEEATMPFFGPVG